MKFLEHDRSIQQQPAIYVCSVAGKAPLGRPTEPAFRKRALLPFSLVAQWRSVFEHVEHAGSRSRIEDQRLEILRL